MNTTTGWGDARTHRARRSERGTRAARAIAIFAQRAGSRTRRRDALTRSDELTTVLGEFARTMLNDGDAQDILDLLVGRIAQLIPGVSATVEVPGPGLATRRAASDPALADAQMQTELGEEQSQVTPASKESAVSDLRRNDRFPRLTSRASQAELAATFRFPVHRDGAPTLGVLMLHRRAAGPLSTVQSETVRTLVDVAGAYLINADTRRELQDSSA